MFLSPCVSPFLGFSIEFGPMPNYVWRNFDNALRCLSYPTYELGLSCWRFHTVKLLPTSYKLKNLEIDRVLMWNL